MKKNYFKNICKLLSLIEATDSSSRPLELWKAIAKVQRLFLEQAKNKGKLIFIGNGASASIASHIAVDIWKNLKIPSFSFNDASLLTCISNDFGYENVFQKPLEVFALKQDILIAISSSGRSKNILRAAAEAKKIGCLVITLSGFSQDNPLRSCGDFNFYVPSDSYGMVEVVHTAICHCFLDTITESPST